MSRKKSFSELRAVSQPGRELAGAIEARLAAAARLELARAVHHLRATRKRRPVHALKKGTKIGGSFAADEWRRQTLGLVTAGQNRRGFGELLSGAVQRLMKLEERGLVSAAEAEAALEDVTRQLRTTTKVGTMPTKARISEKDIHKLRLALCQSRLASRVGSDDLPAEMGSFSDGVTDDASFDPEIIGCNSGCSENVSGIPSYLFSKKNLQNPALRRRLGAAIKALTPKVRRRVLQRLHTAVSVASRVAGIRSATPSIGQHSGGWAAVSGARQSIAVGRCPYANVAGALTP